MTNQYSDMLSVNNVFGNFNTVIMNAAGPKCTTEKELIDLMNCPYTGAVISKSCTLNYREGNPLPRYHDDVIKKKQEIMPIYSINSTGLANLGHDFYCSMGVNQLKSKRTSKPYIISVAGLIQNENLTILKNLTKDNNKTSCDAIELNLSCPNVIGKPQIGYDFDSSQELLRKVFEQGINDYKLGLKLPPYFDLVHYDNMVSIISEFPISFITCINSLGNGLIIDWKTESVVIKPKGGFGGIGGSVVKPFALANVRKFKELMPDMMVIGCGGVRNGSDAFEHLLAGADLVQVGTQLMAEGVSCFERINRELVEIMKNKNYANITEFQGKLKVI